MYRSKSTLKTKQPPTDSSLNLSMTSVLSHNPSYPTTLPLSTEISRETLPIQPPKVHRTATEKYYLQIIETMKTEISSLMQIIKAKDKEIEQLKESKGEFKAANAQMRMMLGQRKGVGRKEEVAGKGIRRQRGQKSSEMP